MARHNKPTRSTRPLAVAYLRVSTEDQNLGPQAQLASIERWARAQGLQLVATFEDVGVSGGTPIDRRPGFLAALAALEEHGAAHLVVAKRDRLARDVVIAAAAERLVEGRGARVASADGTSALDTPEGMLMRTLVDAFAAYERALVRSRTSAALQVKKARGERVGEIPLGYRLGADGRQLVEDDREQLALRRLHELRDAGFSARAIADALTEEGHVARGARWHSRTVSRLLERRAPADIEAVG